MGLVGCVDGYEGAGRDWARARRVGEGDHAGNGNAASPLEGLWGRYGADVDCIAELDVLGGQGPLVVAFEAVVFYVARVVVVVVFYELTPG